MKQFILIVMALLALNSTAFAKTAGIIQVRGTLTPMTKLFRVHTLECEMSPYNYFVTGDYKVNGVTKTFRTCFASIAIPLPGSEDHGGSPTGDFVKDATNTLAKYAGKRVLLTFVVSDVELLEGGLQTLLAIEPIEK